jgi:hypothetical protein
VVYAGGAEPAPITPTGAAGTFAKATNAIRNKISGPSVPPIDPKASDALADTTRFTTGSDTSLLADLMN